MCAHDLGGDVKTESEAPCGVSRVPSSTVGLEHVRQDVRWNRLPVLPDPRRSCCRQRTAKSHRASSHKSPTNWGRFKLVMQEVPVSPLCDLAAPVTTSTTSGCIGAVLPNGMSHQLPRLAARLVRAPMACVLDSTGDATFVRHALDGLERRGAGRPRAARDAESSCKTPLTPRRPLRRPDAEG